MHRNQKPSRPRPLKPTKAINRRRRFRVQFLLFLHNLQRQNENLYVCLITEVFSERDQNAQFKTTDH